MTASIDQLQNLIQYQFRDKRFLEEALTHRSALNEGPDKVSNERLEFLGDAVLELVISEYLFNLYPTDPEGILTAARSAIVRTESLAKVAIRLHLGDYLKMSRGEENGGGRQNPALLANTTESLIGGIFKDAGLQAASNFIRSHLIPLSKEILAQKDFKDPKSLLQEKVQDLGYTSPAYETISESGPDHDKIFVITVSVDGKALAEGSGKSKQLAQQAAAGVALGTYSEILSKKTK